MQLHALQKKLHCALSEYYRLSGQYNEAELARLHCQSDVNGRQIGGLQGALDTALHDIATFLRQQMPADANNSSSPAARHDATTPRQTVASSSGPRRVTGKKGSLDVTKRGSHDVTKKGSRDVIRKRSSHEVMVS